jgi:hypothetical protein
MPQAAVKKDPTLAGPTRPLGSPDVPQFYLPAAGISGKATYTPRVYGAARIQFADRRRRLDETTRVAFLAPIDPAARTLDWDAARPTTVTPDQLLKEAPGPATYLPLSASAMHTPSFARWAKGFDRWLARTQRMELTTKHDPPETISVGPKRGGVSVELVAIVWEASAEGRAPSAGS